VRVLKLKKEKEIGEWEKKYRRKTKNKSKTKALKLNQRFFRKHHGHFSIILCKFYI